MREQIEGLRKKMIWNVVNWKKNLILNECIMVNWNNWHLVYRLMCNQKLLENDFLRQLTLIFQPERKQFKMFDLDQDPTSNSWSWQSQVLPKTEMRNGEYVMETSTFILCRFQPKFIESFFMTRS